MLTTILRATAAPDSGRRFALGSTVRAVALAALASLGLASQSQAQGVLEQWSLATSAAPTTVATGVTGTSPTFTGLVSLTTAPYSTGRGQGFAPAVDGSGWPGTQTLSRTTRFEDFTVTAATGYSVRVDSLILSSVINNSANGRFWVSYSTDGFATAPQENSGMLIPAAATATPAGGPTFAIPPFLPNSTNASAPIINTHTYRVGLNGTTGVTIAAGQTLTMRLYYAVGSTSARPAYLKMVSAKGTATASGPFCADPTAVSVGSITATTAQLSFTAGAGNTSYTVSYTPLGGSSTTLSPAPTASPVSLTGLTPSTDYTVTLQSSCGQWRRRRRYHLDVFHPRSAPLRRPHGREHQQRDQQLGHS
jgi:hypothetical protein